MRTETEILKDFEKLGYVIENNESFCEIEHHHYKKKILINKILKMFGCGKVSLKPYETIINGTKMETKHFSSAEPSLLSINEFELLHELFECWGWLE